MLHPTKFYDIKGSFGGKDAIELETVDLAGDVIPTMEILCFAVSFTKVPTYSSMNIQFLF